VREAVAARAPAPSVWKWLLPLLGLAALALLWALWPTAQTVPPPATTTAPTTTAPAATAPWPIKIYFASGSKTLTTEDSARIQQAADYLKANPATAVDITGYADQTGGTAANEELAKERAQAVRGALVAAGIDEGRTNLVPPVSVTAGAPDDPEARRVEIRPKP
jgi:cytochrome c oxidase subunit 2